MFHIPKNKLSSGQATIEMLLVLAVMIPILFGAIELVRAISIKHSLDSGTFLATRAISLSPTDLGYAQNVVSDAVNNNVMGGGAISNFSAGSLTWDDCPNGQTLGCKFTYSASLEYTPWLPLIGGDPVVISSRHHGIIEQIN